MKCLIIVRFPLFSLLIRKKLLIVLVIINYDLFIKVIILQIWFRNLLPDSHPLKGDIAWIDILRDAFRHFVTQCLSVTFADWFLSSPVPIWSNSTFRSMYSVLFKCNSDLLSMLKYARRRPTDIACIVMAVYCTNCLIRHTLRLIAGCDQTWNVRFTW